MFATLKSHVGSWLWSRSMRKTHSRWEWRTASRYNAYWEVAQRSFKPERPFSETALATRAEYFLKDFASFRTEETTQLLNSLRLRVLAEEKAGGVIFDPSVSPLSGSGWAKFPEVEALLRGDLGDSFRAIFGSEFKISNGLFGRKYGGVSPPKLWHSDTGPGTCLNVFCYLSDGFPENGPTIILPWKESLEIFQSEKAMLHKAVVQNPLLKSDKAALRNYLADYYEQRIAASYQDKVEMPNGPAGTIVIFNNNTLHAAQPPAQGKSRLVLHMRVYPSTVPPDFARYAKNGLPRKVPCPAPDEIF